MQFKLHLHVSYLQACRGSELDHGVEMADAAAEEPVDRKVYRIPSEADILYCYSTVPGKWFCTVM